MKKIKLEKTSIVLLTQGYVSPVTHDFLITQKIIPSQDSGFQLIPNISFFAPPISQMIFQNGLSIINDPEKIIFQVSKGSVTENEQEHCLSLLQDISSKYVESEPFKSARYLAIGINLHFIRDDLIFNPFIEKSITSDSPCWFFESQGSKGKVNDIKFSYFYDNKQVNVTISKLPFVTHPQNKSNDQNSVSRFDVNVHYNQPNNHTNINKIIKEIREDYQKSKHFIGGLK